MRQKGFNNTYSLTKLTRTAEVNDLDGATLGITEQYVLGFEVAVYDVELGSRQEQQRRAQLLCKFARQIETDTAEVCVPQQVVQIVG